LRAPRGRALRGGRHSEPGRIYLVTTVTEGRQPLFRMLRPARIVIHALHHSLHAKTLCYCLMPDHLHWLLQLKEGGNLSAAVQAVKSISSRRTKPLLEGYVQRVWQPGFHDHALRADEDLHDVARYVVANPLRGGLVRSLRDYPHWDATWL
jgi:putative transposase